MSGRTVLRLTLAVLACGAAAQNEPGVSAGPAPRQADVRQVAQADAVDGFTNRVAARGFQLQRFNANLANGGNSVPRGNLAGARTGGGETSQEREDPKDHRLTEGRPARVVTRKVKWITVMTRSCK